MGASLSHAGFELLFHERWIFFESHIARHNVFEQEKKGKVWESGWSHRNEDDRGFKSETLAE